MAELRRGPDAFIPPIESQPNNSPMKAREYEITIGPTGEVEIHVEGFQGKGCVEAIRFFEQMIGQTQELRHTSGYYEPDEDVTLHNQQRH